MLKTQAVEVIEPGESREVVTQAITPMAMIEHAIQKGAGIDVIEKLMALSERWDRHQAKKAFDAAMAAAKSEIPTISKNRTVDFTGKTGIRTNYKYEDLGEIARTIDPILAKHGLSYRYRTTSDINAPVTVTCIVSHRDGHSEENTLSAGRDDTGNKNPIQSIGSTVSFLQRYTLKSSFGLAASNDDDGVGSGKSITGTISDPQRAELQALIDESQTDIAKFVGLLGVEALNEIQAKDFEGVKLILKQKTAVAKLKAAKE